MKIRSASVGVLCLVASSCAIASEPYGLRPYFDIGPKMIFTDDRRLTDDGIGFSFGGGVPLHRYFGLELELHNIWYDADGSVGSVDWTERGAGLNFLFTYPLRDGWVPYASIGAGVAESDLDFVGDTLDMTYSYGAGIFKYFGGFGLRADVKYRQLDFNDSMGGSGVPGFNTKLDDLALRLGLVIPFGDAMSYGDGASGETLVDTDGDGVPDDRDLCPGTPSGVAVDERGCPLDSDGDGVPDYLDKCPDTAAGVVVNKDGCPVDAKGPSREFETVTFAFDRSDLTDYARGILDSASKVIEELSGKHAGLVVQIDGHTDSVGSPGYNQALSERRANTVKQYLVRKGVDARRVETRAFGLNKPMASNDTEEGRAKNRRAEVRTMLR